MTNQNIQELTTLLIPKSEYIQCVYDNLDEDIYYNLIAISEYFRVSLGAVKTREKFLEVFSW